MTPEQRYMMDAQGFLILRGAMSDAEVEAGRAGCDSYVHAMEAARAGGPAVPPAFTGNSYDAGGLGSTYGNGHVWSTALERLLFHRATWPIVLELTGGEPLMNGGVTLYDDFSRGNAHAMGGFLHCKRDAQKNNPDALDPEGLDPAGYREPVFCRAREDGTIECDNFVVFPYFDGECAAPLITNSTSRPWCSAQTSGLMTAAFSFCPARTSRPWFGRQSCSARSGRWAAASPAETS